MWLSGCIAKAAIGIHTGWTDVQLHPPNAHNLNTDMETLSMRSQCGLPMTPVQMYLAKFMTTAHHQKSTELKADRKGTHLPQQHHRCGAHPPTGGTQRHVPGNDGTSINEVNQGGVHALADVPHCGVTLGSVPGNSDRPLNGVNQGGVHAPADRPHCGVNQGGVLGNGGMPLNGVNKGGIHAPHDMPHCGFLPMNGC